MIMNGFDRQFAVSVLLFAIAASGILAGLFFLVLLTGPAGCAALLGAVAVFLRWFYRGRRPDLPPEGPSALWISGD